MKWKDLPLIVQYEFIHGSPNDERIIDEFFDQKQVIMN
jgi:hypothetical protein